MSKFILRVYTGIILGAVLHGGSLAENAASGYTYQPVDSHVDFHAGYQWRPAESSYPQTHKDMPMFRGGAELSPGGIQSPMSMPPGAYRPIEEERTISPQVRDFRFRAILPNEQSRISPSAGMHDRHNGRAKYRDEDTKMPFRIPETKYKYRFRPDTRFPSSKIREKNYGTMTGPLQTYPPVHTTPVFRQENRGR